MRVNTTAGTPAPPPVFTSMRTFAFPREKVWQAHARAEHLAHWWGPKGCKLEVVSLDFRPGGLFHYRMGYSSGAASFGRFVYREIEAPRVLKFFSSFANDNAGIARAPFSDVCPLEIENTLTFAQQGSATVMKLQAVPFGASAAEIAFFRQLCENGLEQGYGGTYDQLSAYLEREGS